MQMNGLAELITTKHYWSSGPIRGEADDGEGGLG